MLSDDDIRALRDDAAKLRTFVGPWLGDGQHANVNGYALADRIERLLAEVERLREALTAANAQAERFEREWYLRGDEVERLRRDATRYRWLRGDSCMDHSARWTQWEVRRWDAPIWTNDLRRADLDAAIDDAMRKEPDHAR